MKIQKTAFGTFLFSAFFAFNALLGAAQKRPNVIIMLADDLGWRDISCAGSTYFKTPNIDALAQGGMRFTGAYSASPLCSPTRSSILTGCYPARTHITVPNGHVAEADIEGAESPRAVATSKATTPRAATRLNPKFKTIAQSMQTAGYATAFYGKWHLGSDPYIPENFGFETVVGGRQFSGPPYSTYFGPWDKGANMPDVKKGAHADDVITAEALKFIEKEHAEGKPFFICLWFFSVHAPFESKPELVKKYAALKDPQNPQHSPTMAAMINVLDANVGRVEQKLKELGIDKDTLIIFTSDNGGNMYNVVDNTTPTNNAPLAQGKGHPREGGVRVPLIVKYPPLVKAGALSSARVVSPDFYPTLLDIAGIAQEPEAHKDGADFKPALEGKPYERTAMLIHHPHNIPSTSIYEGPWKLTRFWYNGERQTHRHELYDLSKDVSEIKDVAAEHPDIVKAMSKKLDDEISRTNALKPLKNPNYKDGTECSWYAQDGAALSISKEGALKIKSKAGGSIAADDAPKSADGFIMEFEARSQKGAKLLICYEYTKGKERKIMRGTAENAQVKAGGAWQKLRVKISPEAQPKTVRIAFENAAELELKNIRPLSPDGSAMSGWWYY